MYGCMVILATSSLSSTFAVSSTFSVFLVFNLLFSSSSKTEIIKSDFTELDKLKYSETTQKDIIASDAETTPPKEPVAKELASPEQEADSDLIIKHGSINKQPIYCELRDHNVNHVLGESDQDRCVIGSKIFWKY